MTTYYVHHARVDKLPAWYYLEAAPSLEAAERRARRYAIDHGGHGMVADESGEIVFATDWGVPVSSEAEVDAAARAGTPASKKM